MPTITEIQNPDLTYCQKYDVYCYCPKCEDPTTSCVKHYFHEDHCQKCVGPNEADMEYMTEDVYECEWKIFADEEIIEEIITDARQNKL